MIETIYIENELMATPQAQRILAQFPTADKIACDRYTEVFNPKKQNFRLQKQKPALIIAQKFDRHVLRAPDDYGIGGIHNYYFSYMLNCIYDCRYCFLQGMYQSAHYVLFINYSDFFHSMDSILTNHKNENVWFFSGYDCDSLALDPISGFTSHLIDFLKYRKNAYVELRTKSTQIRSLLKAPPMTNLIVAFSMSPTKTADKFEHKTPSIEKRLNAMRKLADKGWPIGLRFDPLIFDSSFEERYRTLFAEVFSVLSPEDIHSVTIGPFRMPKPFFQKLVALYPEEPLLASPFQLRSGSITYAQTQEEQMMQFCQHELRNYIATNKIFSCWTGGEHAKAENVCT
ncbi:MAG: DNA photolyase [Acidiferrobacteraceae bacterium]|nr:DNA photolyase [Acidiferrobacteraceae bacterium]|tara:strand:- start:1067 stop:2095 length:1029 start_codon:yes stop_codon:yes gene_type:complete